MLKQNRCTAERANIKIKYYVIYQTINDIIFINRMILVVTYLFNYIVNRLKHIKIFTMNPWHLKFLWLTYTCFINKII